VMSAYVLTTVHTDGVRRQEFPTWEAADAAARATNPDVDGSMLPNVPAEFYDGSTYESGVFWFGNRYALIHKVVTVPTDGLTDEQYAVADRLRDALEAAGPAGLTPSQAGRKTGTTTTVAYEVLRWMVDNHYAHTTGNGAWTHYHAGRAR
jgi:hypothetical protein